MVEMKWQDTPPSCAGLFIASHLGFEWPGVWMHVDMAAPSAVVRCSVLVVAT